jgi:hypothetical protein
MTDPQQPLETLTPCQWRGETGCSRPADGQPPVAARCPPFTGAGPRCPFAPHFDRHTGEFFVGDTKLHGFPKHAKNVRRVLAAFEDDGWPFWIDDPWGDRSERWQPRQSGYHKRLENTVYWLNQTFKGLLICFATDGPNRRAGWKRTAKGRRKRKDEG